MSVRDDIAAAASTVEGVNVSPSYRQVSEPGTGFLQLVSTTRDDTGLGWLDTWHVVIALSQDWPTAEAWVDSHRFALITALDSEVLVTGVTPQQIQLDSGPVIPCVVVEGSRESE